MDTKLSPIKNRFPSRSDLIEFLYRNDRSFNSLCDDYYLVVERIKRCGSSEVSISLADLVELKTLLSELEQEMNIYFNEA
jgi:uncharacterized protein YdcH (DUF465 family)